jgi:hypothetical protein
MSGRRWRARSLEAALAVTVFGGTFLASSSGAVPTPEVTLHWKTAAEDGYMPSMRAPAGQELAFVFIGASRCRPSNHESLPAAVEQAKLLLHDRAARSGRSFTALGIARDWRVDAGLAHLARFGRFDEVVAGRNWLNLGLLRYVWEDVPGEAATPQVLVLDRRLVDRNSAEAAEGVVQDERLVARLLGWDEIERWVERGAPLPDLPAVSAPTSTLPTP